MAADGEVVKVFFSTMPPADEVAPRRCRECPLFFSGFAYRVLVRTRWPFVSNFLFFAGNLCYITMASDDLASLSEVQNVSSAVESDDTRYHILNFGGAILFLLNPISDFLANWAENKALEENEKLHHINSEAEARQDEEEQGVEL